MGLICTHVQSHATTFSVCRFRVCVLGGDGSCTEKMVSLAGDAIGNVMCTEAGLVLSKMPNGQAFDRRYIAR